MSDIIAYLIAGLLIIIYIVGATWLLHDIRKKIIARSYVYPKTGTTYYVEGKIKLKNPSTGEWHEAVLYTDKVKKEGYAREYEDFFEKFIPFKDWKDGKRG